MLKQILILLCLLAPFTLQAQNADMRIGTLMNESHWFELEHALKTTPRDSLHPLLYKMGAAMTHHYFNRPDSACIVLADLLNNHPKELGDNTLNMAILMGMNLARANRYAEAADLMQSICDQLTAQGMDSTQTAAYLNGEEDGSIGLNLLERLKRVILNLKEMYMEAVAE